LRRRLEIRNKKSISEERKGKEEDIESGDGCV